MDQDHLLCILSLQLNIARLRLCLMRRNRRRRERRWWVRPINRTRRQHGHYHNLFKHMKDEDHEEFFEYTRMWPQKFDELVALVTPFLQSNSIRKPLPVELKVALTLSYLAHGDSVRSASSDYRIGRSTAHKIIPQVCTAIWQALQPIYLPPMTRERWEAVAQGFEEKCQFPNCCGSVGGKHVQIQAPPRSGSGHFNFKEFFSVVIMAACDHRYRFTWVDIGQYGSVSDGGVWSRSEFGAAFEREEVDLPPPKILPNSNILSHHVLVGDEAFPLKTNMMCPYSRINLGDAERVFNYRLSRTRRVIENAFGILVSRWRILTKTICCSPDNASNLMKAIVCLHNFIMAGEDEHVMLGARMYCPPQLVDRDDGDDELEGEWRRLLGDRALRDLGSLGANNAPSSATVQRNLLRDYFLSPAGEAQAPWQYIRAFRGLVINPV